MPQYFYAVIPGSQIDSVLTENKRADGLSILLRQSQRAAERLSSTTDILLQLVCAEEALPTEDITLVPDLSKLVIMKALVYSADQQREIQLLQLPDYRFTIEKLYRMPFTPPLKLTPVGGPPRPVQPRPKVALTAAQPLRTAPRPVPAVPPRPPHHYPLSVCSSSDDEKAEAPPTPDPSGLIWTGLMTQPDPAPPAGPDAAGGFRL